jgi:hypothetical protein
MARKLPGGDSFLPLISSILYRPLMRYFVLDLKDPFCTSPRLDERYVPVPGQSLNFVCIPNSVSRSRLISLSIGKEYALADSRFESADSTLVSVEILTVFGIPPLCCYIIRQLIRDDPARHYWIIVLCTAELYGGLATLSSSNFTLLFLTLLCIVYAKLDDILP